MMKTTEYLLKWPCISCSCTHTTITSHNCDKETQKDERLKWSRYVPLVQHSWLCREKDVGRVFTIFGILFTCVLFLREGTTTWAPLEAQWLKNPLVMQEKQVRSLGREDSLEKEMATRSSILAWRIPWTEEPDGLQFMGVQRVQQHWATNTSA